MNMCIFEKMCALIENPLETLIRWRLSLWGLGLFDLTPWAARKG